MFKPHLACDADETKLKFPLIAMPKIDGVRGLNVNGDFVGRSLKPHGNTYIRSLYSGQALSGIDGELSTLPINHPDLCRITTGDVNRYEGEPDVMLNAFDLINSKTEGLPYEERILALEELVYTHLPPRIRIVESHDITCLEELYSLEESFLDMGFEGIILRDPNARHKSGRSTAKSNGYLRIKRFIEEDALVVGIVEGNENKNEAKKNELGRTERSSHQENLVPNGMIGALICRVSKDVVYRDELILSEGQEITVSAGALNHVQRKYFFENPDKIVGQIIKFKMFPKGVKDKPRFPTFHSFRATSDIALA